jgi:predicted nucleic acid-binding protein
VSLVLVDTSVWIELISGRAPTRIADDDVQRFVTCGPIVQEVLQGMRESAAAREFCQYFEAVPCLADPLPRRLYVAGAEIFRSGRRRGCTIRSSVDCLIAAVAIDYGIPVWHRDRDFDAIAGFTELEVVSL